MYVAIDILIMCKSEGGEPKSDNHQWNVFHEKPEQLPTGIVVMTSLIKDSVWGDIPVHTYPRELSEAAKKYAIPVEKIKNGEDILKRASNAPKFPSVKQKSTTYLGQNMMGIL